MKLKDIKKLSNEEKSYFACFFDTGGSITTQIVKGRSYKYGYTVRVTITFFQSTKEHWFLMKLHKRLGKGWKLRKRNDGMSELFTTGFTPVSNFIKEIQPYLIKKKRLSRLVLEIIDEYSKIQIEADFLQVCKKIDITAKYTYSKKRKHTYASVKDYLNSPVETENAFLRHSDN